MVIGNMVHRVDGFLKNENAVVVDPFVSVKVTENKVRAAVSGLVRIRFDGDRQTYLYPKEAIELKRLGG